MKFRFLCSVHEVCSLVNTSSDTEIYGAGHVLFGKVKEISKIGMLTIFFCMYCAAKIADLYLIINIKSECTDHHVVCIPQIRFLDSLFEQPTVKINGK